MRPTPRSPALYVGSNRQKLGAKTVLHLNVKSGETLDFGDECKSVADLRDTVTGRISSPNGQLQVISVPYEDGNHVCTSVEEAICLIEQLEELHENGNVHGDIRGLNCVFHSESKTAKFIDFDFGGKHGKTTYPSHYQIGLKDGNRVPCAEHGAIIHKWHDISALFGMFRMLYKGNLIWCVDAVEEQVEVSKDDTDQERDTKFGKMLSLLKNMLRELEDRKVKPLPSFQLFLDSLNPKSGATQKGREGTPIKRQP